MLAHAMPHKPLAASPAFYTPETPDDLYADVIRELDWSVGEIFASLKKLGVDKNTLVIFTSDNGASWGGNNGGLRGKKAQSWDGGLRVPFIAHWPGNIPAGIVNPELASCIDLLPTLARVTGTDLPDTKLDGLDIWPLLIDSTAPGPHPFLVGMRGDSVHTIHTKKWKLHVKPAAQWKEPTAEDREEKDPRGPDGVMIIAPPQYSHAHFPGLTTGDYSRDMMLFDAEKDPGEQRDLSKNFPEVVERLKGYHDALPTPKYVIPKPSPEMKMNPGGSLDFWK
jgi:N-acetylgalactosamine-6-sulfatase